MPAVRTDDLLPDLAKLGIVLQAEGDLVELDRALREVQVLDARGSAGAGVLAGKGLAGDAKHASR